MAKLKNAGIPQEMAETAFDRIKEMIEQYHRGEIKKNKKFDGMAKNPFDLKALCVSCYVQGLRDAKRILTGENKKIKDGDENST